MTRQYGDTGYNTMYAEDGNDVVYAGDGGARIEGQAGADIL